MKIENKNSSPEFKKSSLMEFLSNQFKRPLVQWTKP
jgi:hypothetical protein